MPAEHRTRVWAVLFERAEIDAAGGSPDVSATARDVG